jgi:ABC-type amino acid transport substrate-binding protein
VIYARREQAPVSSLSDLAGKRLAQIAGTAEAAQLRADYPDMEVLEFADSRSALEAIAAR